MEACACCFPKEETKHQSFGISFNTSSHLVKNQIEKFLHLIIAWVLVTAFVMAVNIKCSIRYHKLILRKIITLMQIKWTTSKHFLITFTQIYMWINLLTRVIHDGKQFITINFFPTPTSLLLHCVQVFNNLIFLYICYTNTSMEHSWKDIG